MLSEIVHLEEPKLSIRDTEIDLPIPQFSPVVWTPWSILKCHTFSQTTHSPASMPLLVMVLFGMSPLRHSCMGLLPGLGLVPLVLQSFPWSPQLSSHGQQSYIWLFSCLIVNIPFSLYTRHKTHQCRRRGQHLMCVLCIWYIQLSIIFLCCV